MNVMPTSSLSDTLRALETLVLKRGITLGRMSEQDLLITLGFASLSIPASTAVTEAGVNQALKTWLAGDGEMLRIDHVELRRSLIDMGYWVRDGYGRSYLREPLEADHPAQVHVVAMSTIDLRQFVLDARVRRDAERTQRQAAFQGDMADRAQKAPKASRVQKPSQARAKVSGERA